MASLEGALTAIQTNPGWTVAALDYELGYLLEPRSAPAGWFAKAGQPLARFWRFRERSLLSEATLAEWLAMQGGHGAAGVGGLGAALNADDYQCAVQRIQSWIAAGDCYQVNYTFPFAGQLFGSPAALYARLRERQPVRYGGLLVDPAVGAIVSLSPELFVSRQGDRLLTRPMKGTVPAGAPVAELLESEKNRAENLMIVDLLRNDLGRLAVPGSVRVERLFDVEDYPSVRQMVSEISATVQTRDFGSLLRALFPCGSITGAPKIRAMQIIGELESEKRGLYTGAFGWLAPDGDCCLNVAIRTLEIDTEGRVCLGIGSGIVADSDAEAEWAECLLKSSFLQACDPGLRLIETLRCEHGRYPRLAGHLARLARSAAWFGFPFDASLVRERLAQVAGDGVRRVRLTLGKLGDVECTSAAMLDLPAARIWSARVSPCQVDAHNLLLQHKTTDRQIYDDALADLRDGEFDLVFLNQRGEVAEGARSNIFVERDGRFLTPPLSAGCLAGVLRAELLSSGRAVECILTLDDLKSGFWFGNALRGLLPARLAQ